MNNIPEFSVTEISNLTKQILEENFNLIKVRGEISSVKNFKGHLYFSIKDENFILNSVCWSSKVPFLQVNPEDGIEVVAEGKLTTYAKSSISTYQLQVNQIEVKGEGAILKLIEQRKKKLEIEGLFREDHKKPLPFLPESIGVITSSSGSVIMDIINRIQARCPSKIKLYPVSVQGMNASKEIIDGLDFFKTQQVDVIIIARGGGGIEDLMPFNDEALVRKVYSHSTPIISAIGHETDFTLLDFVADLRAATPTAAAEIAVPEIKNLKEKSNSLLESLDYKIKNLLKNNTNLLRNYKSFLRLNNLKKIINDNSKSLVLLNNNFILNFSSFIKIKSINVDKLNSILKSLNVENVLKRGFVLLKNKKGKIIKNSKSLKKEKNFKIKLYDDELEAQLKKT
ncbi:exodeoxyribonuclease VII large subunit [Pelagibacteraceae bacterium]|nr:exodeoxyribonuclease VII large subunit [Pelagibacteraceae bacterium]